MDLFRGQRQVLVIGGRNQTGSPVKWFSGEKCWLQRQPTPALLAAGGAAATATTLTATAVELPLAGTSCNCLAAGEV